MGNKENRTFVADKDLLLEKGKVYCKGKGVHHLKRAVTPRLKHCHFGSTFLLHQSRLLWSTVLERTRSGWLDTQEQQADHSEQNSKPELLFDPSTHISYHCCQKRIRPDKLSLVDSRFRLETSIRLPKRKSRS